MITAMKSMLLKLSILMIAAVSLAPVRGAEGAGTSTNLQASIPRSTFVVPASQKEGKDPFFPYRILKSVPDQTRKTIPVTAAVEIKGFSGTADRPLVILNNQTFGLDEESPLITDSGRVQVHVIDIKIGEGATIEVEGEKMVLQYNPFRFK